CPGQRGQVGGNHPIEERAIKERAHQDRRESRAWIAIGRYGGDRQERGTGRDECPWRDAPREHGERGKEQTGNGNREPRPVDAGKATGRGDPHRVRGRALEVAEITVRWPAGTDPGCRRTSPSGLAPQTASSPRHEWRRASG